MVNPLISMFLDQLFFRKFCQTFSDRLLYFWRNYFLSFAISLLKGSLSALAVLSTSVAGNTQPFGNFALRESFYF